MDKCLLQNKHFREYIRWRSVFWHDFEIVPHPQNVNFLDARRCYRTNDIYQDDVVLDIGANVGGFSIPAAVKAKKVFSVEPIYNGVLYENMMLNNIKNITIMKMVLGDGSIADIEFGGEGIVMDSTSLSDIIKSCGGHVDFLKLDCEGGEWSISLDDLNPIFGIRRIEAEIHPYNGHKNKEFLELLTKAGFEYDISNGDLMLVHARRLQ